MGRFSKLTACLILSLTILIAAVSAGADTIRIGTCNIERLGRGANPVSVPLAEGSRHFRVHTVRDAIYGNGWYRKIIKVRYVCRAFPRDAGSVRNGHG